MVDPCAWIGSHDHEKGLPETKRFCKLRVGEGILNIFGVVSDDEIPFGTDTVFAAKLYGTGYVTKAVFFVHQGKGGFVRAFDTETYFA